MTEKPQNQFNSYRDRLAYLIKTYGKKARVADVLRRIRTEEYN